MRPKVLLQSIKKAISRGKFQVVATNVYVCFSLQELLHDTDRPRDVAFNHDRKQLTATHRRAEPKCLRYHEAKVDKAGKFYDRGQRSVPHARIIVIDRRYEAHLNKQGLA